MKFAVLNVVSRSVVFVCEAADALDALEIAKLGLDRTKVPAAWSAQPVADLPGDYAACAEAWAGPDAR